jgi:thiol-disulfide isomerase/thioredoxin
MEVAVTFSPPRRTIPIENTVPETRMPLSRRAMLASLPALFGLAAAPARAAERARWSDAAFDAAQAAGRPVLIEVWASWCPTCRAQEPGIEAALRDPALADALFLKIDFDEDKEALRRLRVRSQSTLIAFRGREERGRSIGVTDPAAIRALFLRAA